MAWLGSAGVITSVTFFFAKKLNARFHNRLAVGIQTVTAMLPLAALGCVAAVSIRFHNMRCKECQSD